MWSVAAVAGREPLAAVELRAAIEREFATLRRGVEVLIAAAYRKWGRHAGPDLIRARADEVLDEVVVRALQRADRFDPGRSAHAWLLGFAVNVLAEQERDEWRHQRGRVSMDPPAGDDAGREAETAGLLARLRDLAATDQPQLVLLLELVPPEPRRLLSLAYVEQRDGRDIATLLGIGEGAARVRLHRAVRQLRDAYHRAERFGARER